MMHFSFLCLSAFALCGLGGCGGEGDNPWPPLSNGGTSGTAGDGGAPSNGGAPGNGGAPSNGGGPSNGELAEWQALEACDVPEPCESESFVQLVENYAHNLPKEPVSCVLSGLAERRAGRYLHRTDATFSNGSTAARHLFVVAADGSVAYVRDPSQFFSTPAKPAMTFSTEPAQRCTLKPASYFEACLAEVQASTRGDDDAAWACVFGDGTSVVPSRLDWFESCEREASPRCGS